MTIIQGELKLPNQFKVGIVTARFNMEFTEKLEHGALQRLAELGVGSQQIVQVRVPGSVEIPVAAKALLDRGCNGVVALGAVIRGETAHFDYVCQAVERGLTHLMVETGRPIAFGVLTTENEEQAAARVGGEHGHKGREAAEVLIEMLNLLEKI